jgi:outer membrane lipoprotein-sorting protein
MNSFENIENKIRSARRNTSEHIDRKILTDAGDAFEQSAGGVSRHSFTLKAAAIIVFTALLGLFFIFSRPAQVPDEIVKSQEGIKSTQDLVRDRSTITNDKLRAELEQVIEMEKAGDIDGLLEVVRNGDMPAKVAAVSYLAAMDDSRVQELLNKFRTDTARDENSASAEIPQELKSADVNTAVIATVDSNAQAIDVNDRVPHIVSINPPSGSELPLVCEIEVTFDRPMEPNSYAIVDASNPEKSSRGYGIFESSVDYDAAVHTFIFPVRFPGNWNGSVILQNFVSADGVRAKSVTVSYHTLQKPFSNELMERFDRYETSGELVNVLQKIKDTRSNLKSIQYSIYETSWYGGEERETEKAVFKFQKDRQLFADISGIMNGSFYIGCDGNNCWLYSHGENYERLVSMAYEDVNEFNIDICNPFGLGDSDISDVLRQYNLRYEGMDVLDGRMCYLLSSWRSYPGQYTQNCSIGSYWFDAETLLPVQIFFDFAGGQTILMSFEYQSVNRQISPEEFSYHSLTTLEPSPPEPPDEKYNKTVLTIMDGTSNGRMKVSWYRTGPAGVSGSGLN